MRYSPSLALVASFCAAFLAAPLLVRADPDSVMEQCFLTGCSTALSILKPCGGSGITNSSLEMNSIYTPTRSLGGCQCNYFFHQQLSSCLSCIANLSVNKPEIQSLDGWTQACQGYGYNMTSEPVVTSADDNMASENGGLSKGAIIGIVIGALVLLALVGAILFLRSRKRRQLKSVGEESALGANAPGGAVAIGSGSHHYGTEDDYCLDQQHAGYNDPSGQQQQHPSVDYPNGAYYGANGNHDTMMMQNISNNNNNDYVPPPPHPASTTIQTTTIPSSVGTAAGGYIAASRPSDSYPQSLRSRPTGWDQEKQEPLSSLLSTDHSLHHDKAEYDEGEELEPPQSQGRFAGEDDHSSRRSMTPPRASLQNYRDEFRRPSVDWDSRRGGSDRGSVLNMLRVESSNGDVEPHDSPDEIARRRARAAELFSAESPRR